MKLCRDFYLREDVVEVSSDLLGKVLCTRLSGKLTKLIITETEAYAGVSDRASHAYGNRRTRRTEPMFAEGGTAYVYLCYGLHHLFNVVTNKREVPHAILIRSGVPLCGTATMLRRRNKANEDKTLLAGPGSLAQALGIKTEHTGLSLIGGKIWIEDHGIEIDAGSVTVGPRVGVDYAGDDAHRPYRFRANLNRPGDSDPC